VERAAAVETELKQMGISIDRRKVMSSLMVSAKPNKSGDKTSGEVWVGNNLITTVADDGDQSAMDRAQLVASRIDATLDRKVGVQDIRVSDDGLSVWAGKTLVITVTQGDAKLANLSPEDDAKQIQKNLQQMIWRQVFNTAF
jgi:hypothetical protein